MFVSKLACPFTITSKKIDQAKCIYCCFVTLIMTLKTVHHFYSGAGASPAVLYKTQINNVPNESLLCLKRALDEEYHSSSHPNHFSMALMYHHRFTAAHCNRSMTNTSYGVSTKSQTTNNVNNRLIYCFTAAI